MTDNPMDYFSKSVDNWSAKDWFDRMACAVRDHDKAAVELFQADSTEDKALLELRRQTFHNIISSSAFRLVRDFERQVRAAFLEPYWRPMESAPLDGTHCILAIQEGAFIYNVQGMYSTRQWDCVHRLDVKPLAWMPNVRLPPELLPEGFR